jgi:hypothetical protein
MSQCGQRASFNRDRDLADEPHWCSSVFGGKACGLADRTEIDRFIAEDGKGPYPDMD